MIELEQVHRTTPSLPRPMTTWGPLYPLLIGAFSLFGLSPAAAALVLPLLFAFVTIIATYSLFKSLFDEWNAMLGCDLGQ